MPNQYNSIRRMCLRVIGPSIAYLPTTRDQFALIDVEDAEFVEQWNWQATWASGSKTFYVKRFVQTPIGMETTALLHRELMPQAPEWVDHINGNTLDCRKANLRPASRTQNAWNRKRYVTNTSGFIGVTPRGHRFVARIRARGKFTYIGTFETAELAHAARVEAAMSIHEGFSRK